MISSAAWKTLLGFPQLPQTRRRLHPLQINWRRQSLDSVTFLGEAIRPGVLIVADQAGVDGVTWQEYESGFEGRIRDLHSRIHRGAYRALPSRRVYIPKADGQQRPLGVAALEDKIVQQAVVTILNQIYEEDFKGFSYGFRPGRSPHQALDALCVAIQKRRVNWVLDADIRGFFDVAS